MKAFTKHVVVIAACILSGSISHAQQEGMYSQYSFNLFDLISAYCGDGQHPSLNLRYRAQWLGLPGAPRSASASFHTPTAKETIAWGFRLQTEEIGARNSAEASITGAYRLSTGPNSRLAFALRAGAGNEGISLSSLHPKDEADPLVIVGVSNRWAPLLGASLFFRKATWYTGLEASRIIPSEYGIEADAKRRFFSHYYLAAAKVFSINEFWMLRLNALARSLSAMRMQVEVQAAVLYRGRFWLGSGYRQEKGMLIFTEWQASPYFRIGYSFDTGIGGRRIYPPGHEVFIGIQFRKNNQKTPSLRLF
jgi:type IX secretion system PorP/SprF family membrane protein